MIDPGDRPSICILGGTGFVGRHLAARLAGLGYTVRVPTRSRARHRNLLVLPTVSLVQANVHDPSTLRDICAGTGAVINLVGILNERGRDGRGFEQAHVALARSVLETCGAQSIPRLLHMSALKADTRGPSHYLRTKGEAESLVRAAPGVAATIFRPSLIYGEDDSFINRFARLARLPSPIFPLPRADARFAPVYVSDVVEAFVRALRDPATAGETYELCGPRVYTLRQIVELICTTMRRRRYIAGMPDFVARLQAALMDFVPGKPFSTDNFRSLTVDSVCEHDGLARLGIAPTSLEPVLQRLLGEDAAQARYARYRREAGR